MSRLKKHLRESCLLLAALLPDRAAGAIACVAVPVDAAHPGALACEDDAAYVFHVAGARQAYDKAQFRRALRAQLVAWLARAGATAPGDATVDVWLALPEAAPAATSLRAVVTWDRGQASLVATLPLTSPAAWALQSRDVATLAAGESYPQAFGDQAGVLLVKPKAGADPLRLAALLADHGVQGPAAPAATGWRACHVTALRERATAAALLTDPRAAALLEAATPDAQLEAPALRERAFAFSLATP